MASGTVRPRGNAATAAEFLDVAAEGSDMLAALQGIGYGLLAVADQLADIADAGADRNSRLGEIAASLEALAWEPSASRAPARLARRTARVAGVAGPGKSAVMTSYAARWLGEHPGGLVALYDAKDGDARIWPDVPPDVPWPRAGGAVVPGAADAGVAVQALADAAAWRAWRAEGAGCAECARLDPGRCAEHAADEELAAAYEALRARLAGGAL